MGGARSEDAMAPAGPNNTKTHPPIEPQAHASTVKQAQRASNRLRWETFDRGGTVPLKWKGKKK